MPEEKRDYYEVLVSKSASEDEIKHAENAKNPPITPTTRQQKKNSRTTGVRGFVRP
ncbi:MAG: hypothetical protein ACLTGK_01740 [Eubacterium sp.]